MPMRISMVVFAAGLVLAACGGSSSTVAGSGGDASPDPVVARTVDPPEGESDAASNTDAQAAGESGTTAGAGTEQAAATPDSASPVTPEVAAETAAANQQSLTVSDNPLDTEVLVVADGTITTLAEAATGDRPLLIWFWAPH